MKMLSVNTFSEPNQLREVPESDKKVINLSKEDHSDSEQIKQLQAYLDLVREIAKPGCQPELLTFALSSMSSMVNLLSFMSSNHKFRASL